MFQIAVLFAALAYANAVLFQPAASYATTPLSYNIYPAAPTQSYPAPAFATYGHQGFGHGLTHNSPIVQSYSAPVVAHTYAAAPALTYSAPIAHTFAATPALAYAPSYSSAYTYNNHGYAAAPIAPLTATKPIGLIAQPAATATVAHSAPQLVLSRPGLNYASSPHQQGTYTNFKSPSVSYAY
ncbi:cuticle protein 16.5-like [Sabethes cyaneus]|uniref:cuticle protein 16.5-like n=1 Tax=Sabethes cyaneus TaxID=53552 RepID=UPI00237E1972|nr:cuticle protein 16.5-like [Sabethes cyaneus]